MAPVKWGIMSTARINRLFLAGAREAKNVELVAVASRNPERAQEYARENQIPRAHGSYEALLEEPEVEAVYISLPNSLHVEWSVRALEAGKHVLCEKPFTANAEEAAQVKAVAEQHPDLVVMEAFHYRYHPLFARVLQLLHEGAIGDIRHIDARLCFPLPMRHDIRWQLGLAGGSLMDAGCYTVHMLRHLAGAEPEVTTARARLRSPEVDRFMQADYRFSAGITGRTTYSMLSAQLIRAGFTVTGAEGQIKAFNPMAPQMMHRLTVSGRGGRSTEHVTRRPTYEFQLQAFADAVLRAVPPITGLDDALANMTVIDAVYRAAGLERREPTAVD